MAKPPPKPKTPARQRADAIAAELFAGPPRLPQEQLLSTGCTLLDVALSGRARGAIPKGTYWSLVGASGSSKTWFTFCLFAEAARDPNFAKYIFVHDNAENGALMDVPTYFGAAVVDRLRPPGKGKTASESVEDFYHNVEAAVACGPCIYVLDSMDAVDAAAEVENYEARQHFHDTGKGESQIRGSMGMAKAKANSKHLGRVANTVLRQNGSILVIISQTRDLLNAPFPGMQTYSGGKALKFFSHVQTWTKVKGPVKKHYKGKDREVGAVLSVDVQKNRVCGWEGNLPPVTFLKGYGIDDVGSNVDYLIGERHWKKCGDDEYSAPEIGAEGSRDGLIAWVQDKGQEGLVADLVASVWAEIVAGAAPQRKRRYN